MSLEPAQIESLLPHRPPMVLVQRIVQCDAESIEAVVIFPGMLFDGLEAAPAVWAVEAAAQAAAIHLARQSDGHGGRGGKIVLLRRCRLEVERLATDVSYRVKAVSLGSSSSGFCLFEGTLWHPDAPGTPLVHGHFSILLEPAAQPEPPPDE